MTALVFVDTNVFLYARDSRDRVKQRQAAQWLAVLWQQRTGRTGIQVLSEYYVNATRKLARDEAWDDIQALLAWDPQPVNREVLIRGSALLDRYRLSWWDALVVAAAAEQGCSMLLTEDLQDGATYDGVAVRSPFTLRVQEAVANYAPALEAVSRHRHPGRPRKPRSVQRPGRAAHPDSPGRANPR
jgi:predicted nucleic acid-binding protein